MVAYLSASAASDSRGGSTLTAPAGTAAGDLDIVWLIAKPTSTTFSGVPGDYTALGEITIGSGSQGIDTGPLKVFLWYKVLTAAAESIFVAQSGVDVYCHGRMAFTKGSSNTWEVTLSGSGSDDTSGTSFAVTSDTALAYAAGDMVAVFQGTAGNVTTTSEALTASGSTFTVTERQEVSSTSGQDMGCAISTATLTGSSTAALSYTSTLSSSTGSLGGAVFVRLREVASGDSRTATGATLTLAAQAATASVSAVSRTAAAASLTLTPQAAAASNSITRTASTANLTLTTAGAERAVGGLNPVAGTTTLTVQAEAATGQPGAVSRVSGVTGVALDAQPAVAAISAVSRTASVATLSLTAQAAQGNNVGGSAQTATASPASLVLSASQSTSSAGSVARVASPAALTLGPQGSVAAVGTVNRTASPASLALASQGASRASINDVAASPAGLVFTAQSATRAVANSNRSAAVAALVLTAGSAGATNTFPVTYPATILCRGKVRVHLSGGIYL